MTEQSSHYHTFYEEKYSVQDVLEMPGVEEIVTEYAEKHKSHGWCPNDYELEVAFERHLAVVHFVVAED